MGCLQSKVEEPERFHAFNKHIVESEQKMIYEILEFWLCSSYDEKDKNSFIKSIGNIEMSKLSEPKTINKTKIKMETNKQNIKNEILLKSVTEILNPKE